MKTTRISRTICLLLACLVLLPLVACGKSEETPEVTTEAPVGEATTSAGGDAVTENTDNADALYDRFQLEPVDFGEEEVTLLYWSDREHEEFYVENQTGDLVNDAIYMRNQTVEERLGINFAYATEKGDASNEKTFAAKVNTSISAGDHAYDLVAAHSYTIGLCATQDLLYNLSDIEYVDFEKPWWPDKLIGQATINDKLFFVSGDISANVIYMMYVTFFNKDMVETYKLEDPYTLVENGKWTVDKQLEMCKGLYSDLNGNGAKDIGDQYGQYAYTLHLDSFLWGSDIIVLDTSGDTPVFSADFLGEKTLNLQEKVKGFFYDTSDGYLLTENSKVSQHFAAGLSLFWNDRCRQAISFAEKEINYGIIPIPKYDESQENYATLLGNPFSLYAIPKDSVTPDMAGAVLECMASESYRKISPALYEVALKLKYSQDDVSAKMFDIAKSSVVFDLGRILSNALSGPASTWQKAITGSVSWATTIKAQEKPWNKQLEKMLQVFE
ncbi:MAG: extracellular solute-binding protein [Clostridia bacterium]|nr:extracellular solute-binding protein [Clostridia bacterium]